MKLIDNIIYLEFSDLTAAGVSSNTLFKAKEKQRTCWTIITDPTDKRKVLYQFDTLKDQYKKLVIEKFGHPDEYLKLKPIKDLVQPDYAAEKYYIGYQLNETDRLPEDHAKRYTVAACWLNMLKKVDSDPRIVKDLLKIKQLDAFYTGVCTIIEKDDIGLPKRYRPLRNRLAEYKEKGYEVLISGKFGNQSAAKVNDELSEAVLLEFLAHPNHYDDAFVAMLYNKWAEENGYKPVTRSTVGIWREKRSHEIIADREGREVYNSTFRRKVLRARPSAPGLLWESDDNHLDWWFQGDKASEFKKIKGIIVTDSFNDYVLGYAMTDSEMSSDIVRMAYLNAMHHVRELTGDWHLPFEIKTDQWNISQLRPFYQGLAHYHDTPVGSKNRGWLENFFGHIDWERSMKIGNNNYTGHNITAKTKGVNMEVVKQNKTYWPHISEASNQMAEFIHRLRTAPRNYDHKNESRQAEWLNAWTNLPDEKKITLTEEQVLLKCGFRHPFLNTITDKGIRPTILGNSYAYAVPPAYYMPNVGKKVEVIYNPYDMSRVLVTDNDKLRFLASSMTPVAGCMADMQDGGRSFLNQILAEARADVDAYGRRKDQRKSLLAENDFDTETLIKIGVGVRKEDYQQAIENYQSGNQAPSSSNPFANL